MELPSYFIDFLSGIRPTDKQRAELIEGHKTLRERLVEDTRLGDIVVCTFLQGSYRRSTLVKPQEGAKADVDVVVVTKLAEGEFEPKAALEEFEPFLKEHYPGQFEYQGRSIGIELDEVEMDLVPTSAPSEAEEGILGSASVTSEASLEEEGEWRLAKSWKPGMVTLNESLVRKSMEDEEWAQVPLRIPDRDAEAWDDTDPLRQMRHTKDRNKSTSRHFVNVVKCIKWWKGLQPGLPKHPKGYPLERIIEEFCPDGIKTVASGVTLTLENIVTNYASNRKSGKVPVLNDRGVTTNNVLKRITFDDFSKLYDHVVDAAKLARSAFDADTIAESAKLWRELFGKEFPPPPNSGDGDRGGFSDRSNKTNLSGGRFG